MEKPKWPKLPNLTTLSTFEMPSRALKRRSLSARLCQMPMTKLKRGLSAKPMRARLWMTGAKVKKARNLPPCANCWWIARVTAGMSNGAVNGIRTLIRCTYFKEYAQELAEECGMIQKEVKWPYTCIDWDHAARELLMDYTTISFNGVDYHC